MPSSRGSSQPKQILFLLLWSDLSPASLALYTDCLSLSHQKKVTMKKVSYQIKTNECLMKE